MKDTKTDRAAGHPTTVDAAADYLSQVEDDAVVELDAVADAPDEPTVATEPEPRFEVTLPDGSTEELPVSELIAGYLRRQDYQVQTAELTEQRRGLARLRERIEDLEAHATALRPEHVMQVLPPLPAPDPALAQSDPVGYGRQRAAIDMEVARRQQLMQVIVEAAQHRQAQARARRQAWEMEQQERLLAAWPELAGEGAPEMLLRHRQDLAKHYAFSPDELDMMGDHRLRLMARDALQWRQAEAAAKSAEPARRPPPRTAAPAGTGGMNGATALLDRIGKSGSRERDMRLAAQYLLS